MPYLQLNYCLTSGHLSDNTATDTCRNQRKAFPGRQLMKTMSHTKISLTVRAQADTVQGDHQPYRPKTSCEIKLK